MKKLISLFLSAALLLGSLAGCANTDKTLQNSRTLTDALGRQVAVPEQVNSIVCVGVGALRYTCYLGAASRVVGVEDYETDRSLLRLYNYVNFDYFQEKPVIGSNGVPYVEQIIEAAPEVIVLSRSASVDADDLQAQTGTPVVVISGSDSTLDEGAFDTIALLGELYGLNDHANQLTTYLHSLQEDLDDRTRDIPEAEKPTVYVGGVAFKGYHGFEGTEAGYGPLELIHANNLADTTGQSGAFNIDLEQVLQWDPDVIFLDWNGMELIEEDYAENPDYYQALQAVNEGRVYSQISFRSFASNLDTALADTYYAATILYPEAFADVDPVEKAGEIFEMLLGANPYPALEEAGYALRTIDFGT